MYQNGEECVWVWEGQLKAQRTVGRGREPDVVTHRCFLMQENVMTHAKDSSTRLVLPSSDSTRSCRFRPKWIWYYNAVTQAYATYTHKNTSHWNYGKCNPPHEYFKCWAVNIPSILRNKASMNNNKRNISVHLCQITLHLLFLRWLNIWLMEKSQILLQFECVFATTLKHHRVQAKHTLLSYTIMCLRRKTHILNN